MGALTGTGGHGGACWAPWGHVGALRATWGHVGPPVGTLHGAIADEHEPVSATPHLHHNAPSPYCTFGTLPSGRVPHVRAVRVPPDDSILIDVTLWCLPTLSPQASFLPPYDPTLTGVPPDDPIIPWCPLSLPPTILLLKVSPLTPPVPTAQSIKRTIGWRPKKVVTRPARLETTTDGGGEEDANEEERTPLTPNPAGPGEIRSDGRSPCYAAVRHRAGVIVAHPVFDRSVMVLILLSSACLALERPGMGEGEKRVLKGSNYVFAALFFVEMACKETLTMA